MNKKISKVVNVAIFSALAFIISLISVPLPLIPPFYKLDLSCVVAVLIAYKYGVKTGVMVDIIKNVLSIILLGSTSFGVGELANTLIDISFIIPMVTTYKHSSFKATSAMIISGCLLNYYLLLPMYSKVLNMPLQEIINMGHQLNPAINNLLGIVILAVAPFNLIKGIFLSLSTNFLKQHMHLKSR